MPSATVAALGQALPPYQGFPTFMKAPLSRSPRKGQIAVVGLPVDAGSTGRGGSRSGPRAIRQASTAIGHYGAGRTVSPWPRLVDYGDVAITAPDLRHSLDTISFAYRAVLGRGAKVVGLGGDHSVTLGILGEYRLHYDSPINIIQFDAHTDFWSDEFGEDIPYSHGTWAYHAHQFGWINQHILIGVRSPYAYATEVSDMVDAGVEVIHAWDIYERGISWVIETIQTMTLTAPTYITVDLDVLDPAYAPGVSTPISGGLMSHQLLTCLRLLRSSGVNVIGGDVVECCPPYDTAEITATVGAHVAFELADLL